MPTLNENSADFSHKIWNSKKQIITLANEQKKRLLVPTLPILHSVTFKNCYKKVFIDD